MISPPSSPPALLDPRDASPATARALEAWLSLQRRLALHPERARRLLGDPPKPHRALRALRRAYGPDPAPLPEETAALASLGARGASAVPLGSPLYPPLLRELADAPPLLWVLGCIESLTRPAVAIVGSRAATASGRRFTRRLASELAAAGLVIVSGLARGIDAEAHRGALDAGGASIGVLACGLDRIYPREHRSLADSLLTGGALLCELPPGTPPLPYHFPLRNRLISGLSEAVVVVEARPRSGSLHTARHGLEQGREVLVVPGPVDTLSSQGSNQLLREGAAPVLDASDVLRALRRPIVPAPVPEPIRDPVLQSLAREPATRDELARRLGLGPAELAAALLALELDGRVHEDRDGRLRAVSTAPSGPGGPEPRQR